MRKHCTKFHESVSCISLLLIEVPRLSSSCYVFTKKQVNNFYLHTYFVHTFWSCLVQQIYKFLCKWYFCVITLPRQYHPSSACGLTLCSHQPQPSLAYGKFQFLKNAIFDRGAPYSFINKISKDILIFFLLLSF